MVVRARSKVAVHVDAREQQALDTQGGRVSGHEVCSWRGLLALPCHQPAPFCIDLALLRALRSTSPCFSSSLWLRLKYVATCVQLTAAFCSCLAGLQPGGLSTCRTISNSCSFAFYHPRPVHGSVDAFLYCSMVPTDDSEQLVQ